jgi:hypothetical protein
MKPQTKYIFAALLLIGLGVGSFTGCVGGYVATGGGVYYGGDPWIHDDVIVTGGGHWYGGHDGAYVHPGGGGGHHR